MLKVSRQTDYGILLLTAIVDGSTDSYSARELAGMTHLPLPMVGKILKQLAREDVLVSQRGVKGGYSLARPADEINLVDIISAMEGPIALTECIGSPGECQHEESCPTQVNWHKINRLIRSALEEITLLDMTRPMLGLVELSVQASKPISLSG